MISTEQLNLIEALRELARLYPEMRFGQMLLMVAALASQTALREVSEVTDDDLTIAAAGHVRRRRTLLGLGDGEQRRLEPDKEQLLQRLEALSASARPPLGKLVTALAERSGCVLYDMEDSEMIHWLNAGD